MNVVTPLFAQHTWPILQEFLGFCFSKESRTRRTACDTLLMEYRGGLPGLQRMLNGMTSASQAPSEYFIPLQSRGAKPLMLKPPYLTTDALWHIPKGKRMCSFCDKMHSAVTCNFRSHLGRVHPDESWCVKCLVAFSSAESLMYHICQRTSGKDSGVEVGGHRASAQDSLRCGFCVKTFAHKWSKTYHEYAHIGPPVRCLRCFKVCKSTLHRSRHLCPKQDSMHNRNRPNRYKIRPSYSCPNCEQLFSTGAFLLEHKMKEHLSRRKPRVTAMSITGAVFSRCQLNVTNPDKLLAVQTKAQSQSFIRKERSAAQEVEPSTVTRATVKRRMESSRVSMAGKRRKKDWLVQSIMLITFIFFGFFGIFWICL